MWGGSASGVVGLHPEGSASKGGLHGGNLHPGGWADPSPSDTMGYGQRAGGMV